MQVRVMTTHFCHFVEDTLESSTDLKKTLNAEKTSKLLLMQREISCFLTPLINPLLTDYLPATGSKPTTDKSHPRFSSKLEREASATTGIIREGSKGISRSSR